MSYVLPVFNCILCGRQDTGNPYRVPTVRVSRRTDGSLRLDGAGEREPLCRHCVASINESRGTKGLPPFAIADDAYVAQDERALP